MVGHVWERPKKWHRICFQPKDGAEAGQYRKEDVVISGSADNDKLPKHEDVPDCIKKLNTFFYQKNE
jgi:hypothetical protein